MGAISQGQTAIHTRFAEGFTGKDSGDDVGSFPTVCFRKMQTQKTEFAHLAEGLKIESLLEVMLLYPGNNFLFRKANVESGRMSESEAVGKRSGRKAKRSESEAVGERQRAPIGGRFLAFFFSAGFASFSSRNDSSI